MALPVLQIGTHLLYLLWLLFVGGGGGGGGGECCKSSVCTNFWLEFFYFKMHLLTNEGIHVHCQEYINKSV